MAERWWVWRGGKWTEVEAGELPEIGEIIYILHENEDPDVILGHPYHDKGWD